MTDYFKAFLQARHLDPAKLDELNRSEERQMKNCEQMCEILRKLKDTGQQIIIVPDFDMDGIAAGTLGLCGLLALGFNADLYAPDTKNGYGISAEMVDDLLDCFPQARVILTCDVGITAFEAIEHARSRGLDVLVTDHHRDDDGKPAACCIVDPSCADDPYPTPICGAYVLWKILQEYAKRYGSGYEQDLVRWLQVFAALGTVSDTMPMQSENRQLVKNGTQLLRMLYNDGCYWMDEWFDEAPDLYRQAMYSLHVLCRRLHENGAFYQTEQINEDLIAYYIAPLFNSLKRLGIHSHLAFEAFFDPDPEEKLSRIFAFKEQRKQVESDLFRSLLQSQQIYSPYIYIGEISSGLTGLLANRLMNQSGLPTLVLYPDGDGFRGSGRIPAGMEDARQCLANAGITASGHTCAFGVQIHNSLDLFHAFSELVAGRFDQRKNQPESFDVSIDMTDCLDFRQLKQFYEELESLRPYGREFDAPRIRLRINRDKVRWIPLSHGRHVKAEVAGMFEVLLWNQGERIAEIQQQIAIDGGFCRQRDGALAFNGIFSESEAESMNP